jgi:hypothetical protein
MPIRLIVLWMLLPLLLLAQTPNAADKKQTAPSKPPQKSQTSPKRIRVNLSGFELDKSGPSSSTQIGGATRGNSIEPVLLAPRMAKAYNLRPLFCWQQSNKASSFTFRLMGHDGSQMFTASVTGRSYRYPQDAPALAPGETYSWTIEPELALLGAAAAPARFSIVGGREREQIQTEIAAVGENPEKAAEVYTNHRLWYDSVEVYTSLIETHPMNATLYERRAEIYEQIPVTESLARADLKKAETIETHE